MSSLQHACGCLAWHQMPKKNNEKGGRQTGGGQRGGEESERERVRQAVGNAISSRRQPITQWLNQLTPLNDGRRRRATPPHSLGDDAWLVALVALAASLGACSVISLIRAASKQKVKLNYFCNMQHATKMATMSAIAVLFSPPPLPPLLLSLLHKQTDNQPPPPPPLSPARPAKCEAIEAHAHSNGLAGAEEAAGLGQEEAQHTCSQAATLCCSLLPPPAPRQLALHIFLRFVSKSVQTSA